MGWRTCLPTTAAKASQSLRSVSTLTVLCTADRDSHLQTYELVSQHFSTQYDCFYLALELLPPVELFFQVMGKILKGAVREIGKLGSNGPFFDADHIDLVHFGLSGFFNGVLVH